MPSARFESASADQSRQKEPPSFAADRARVGGASVSVVSAGLELVTYGELHID